MTRGSLPNTDSELMNWAKNFATKLDESYEEFGVSREMVDEYLACEQDYNACYLQAIHPDTRTKGAVLNKNDSRERLKRVARRIIYVINGQKNVTDGQRNNLGITVKSPRSRIGVPDEQIFVQILSVVGRRLKLKVVDITGKKPKGVYAAAIFTHAGEVCIANDAFKFQGISTRNIVTIDFPNEMPPGQPIWITARWLNPRGQPGAYALPKNTNLQGGGFVMSKIKHESSVLMAA